MVVQQIEGAQDAVLAGTIMRGVALHFAAPDLVRITVQRGGLHGQKRLLAAEVKRIWKQDPVEAIQERTALVQRLNLRARAAV